MADEYQKTSALANVIAIALIIALFYVSYIILVDIFAVPVSFTTITNNKTLQGNSNLQFDLNMRYQTNHISYDIDSSCDVDKRMLMLDAFAKLESATGFLIFNMDTNGEIHIKCQPGQESPKGQYYIVGEGGPTSVVNTGEFNVIQEGEVILFENVTVCDNYNTEMHELLHAMGFAHSNDVTDIMYPVSFCNQVLKKNIIDELVRLYSIPSLPDLYFSGASAVKQGSSINVFATVSNGGLSVANGAVIEVRADNETAYTYDAGSIYYGESAVINLKNIRIPSGTSKLELVISDGNELDESNNVAALIIPS